MILLKFLIYGSINFYFFNIKIHIILVFSYAILTSVISKSSKGFYLENGAMNWLHAEISFASNVKRGFKVLFLVEM